jgi:hypothetical protein
MNEYIFLVDRSQSMGEESDSIGGTAMDLIKTALQLCLRNFSSGCLFNICSFGSNHQFMFP